MKRKKIVAGNWKMNMDLEMAAAWLSKLGVEMEQVDCDVILFPSFVLLPDMMDLYEGGKLTFGAQNCSHHEGGAYTGEVSASQLVSIGVDYVLIGHSERREHCGETNEMLKQKIKLALQEGLTPVFCCGEPLSVRNSGSQKEYVYKQLEESLFEFTAAQISEVIIAYEPIWAIGTGLNASPEQAQEMHAFIRSSIAAKYTDKIAAEMPILYGGSCKPDNASAIFSCIDVDGGLIGGASLKAEDFLKIVAQAN
ncbi:MAG: triose-phosphate isomerase [Bacteroidetes bacterium]|nr:triose-phosphate isomerase [Bacteroidota bacterium]